MSECSIPALVQIKSTLAVNKSCGEGMFTCVFNRNEANVCLFVFNFVCLRVFTQLLNTFFQNMAHCVKTQHTSK